MGYGSLIIGITVGTLFGPKPPDDIPDDDPKRRSFGDAPRKDVLKARPADEGDPPNEP